MKIWNGDETGIPHSAVNLIMSILESMQSPGTYVTGKEGCGRKNANWEVGDISGISLTRRMRVLTTSVQLASHSDPA